MSKRLQVLMSDGEFETLKQVAHAQDLAVGEWVRRAIRKEVRETNIKPIDRKLEALAKALRHNHPTADIDQMNREIEAGYQAGLP